MRQALWTEDGLDVVEVEPPPLAAGWVRLSVEACGICGSDLHFWHDKGIRPMGHAPGHEFAGTLLTGPPGMADGRYVGSPLVACGTCEYCIRGLPNLCGRGGAGIGLGRDGGLADFVDVPARNVFPLADGVAPLVASMAEPLAVVVRGVAVGQPKLGSRILVLGAGTIGLLTALVAREFDEQLAITARYPHQRAAAERLGVTVLSEDEAIPWGKQNKPDIIYETVGGAANTLNVAVDAACRGGRVVVLGNFHQFTLEGLKFLMKEIEIRSSYAYGTNHRGDEFATGVALLPRWKDDLAVLQTHQFPLAEANAAFECASEKGSGALKVTILP
jgi:alcohol dehydrogenase